MGVQTEQHQDSTTKITQLIEDTSIIEVSDTTKIEGRIQKLQKECLSVEPELFEEMKTSAGITIADLNKKGYKVLLFFTSHIGCMNCKGTIHDIYSLQGEFLKMNCIPVIAHEEDYETYDTFINSSPQTKIFSDILHMERKQFGKRFHLKGSTIIEEAISVLRKGYAEAYRLMKMGYKNELTYLPKGELGIILAAVFVVEEQKIISEYRKEHKFQRFDLARILIDTDGNGIEIHTSIFECDIPKKKKPTLSDQLENGEAFIRRTFSLSSIEKNEIISNDKIEIKNEKKTIPVRSYSARIEKRTSFINVSFGSNLTKSNSFLSRKPTKVVEKQIELMDVLEKKSFLKFFKLFATKEYSVENVVFYEEVQTYKKITDEKKKKIRIDQMMSTFFDSDSMHEINTSKKLITSLKEEIEKNNFSDDFFDSILTDVIQTNLSDTFQRFKNSELFKEMKDQKKRKKYFLFQ